MTQADNNWSIYLIRCAKGKLYTGVSTDVARRFQEHNDPSGSKGAKYLRGKGPLTLVFQSLIGDKSSALKLEHRVKALSKCNKEQLVHGSLTLSDLQHVPD